MTIVRCCLCCVFTLAMFATNHAQNHYLPPISNSEIIYSDTVYPGKIVVEGAIVEPTITAPQETITWVESEIPVYSVLDAEPIEAQSTRSESAVHEVAISQLPSSPKPDSESYGFRPGTLIWEAMVDLVRQAAISDARADAAAEVVRDKEAFYTQEIKRLTEQREREIDTMHQQLARSKEELQQQTTEIATTAKQAIQDMDKKLQAMERKVLEEQKESAVRERHLKASLAELEKIRDALEREIQEKKQLERQLSDLKKKSNSSSSKKNKVRRDDN